MAENKYLGARGLWDSSREVKGQVFQPGEIMPHIGEEEAIARADMEPVYLEAKVSSGKPFIIESAVAGEGAVKEVKKALKKNRR